MKLSNKTWILYSALLVSILGSLNAMANSRKSFEQMISLETISDTSSSKKTNYVKEFEGILVVNDTVAFDNGLLRDEQFSKKVKKVVIREKGTLEDIRLYGVRARHGVILVMTK